MISIFHYLAFFIFFLQKEVVNWFSFRSAACTSVSNCSAGSSKAMLLRLLAWGGSCSEVCRYHPCRLGTVIVLVTVAEAGCSRRLRWLSCSWVVFSVPFLVGLGLWKYPQSRTRRSVPCRAHKAQGTLSGPWGHKLYCSQEVFSVLQN